MVNLGPIAGTSMYPTEREVNRRSQGRGRSQTLLFYDVFLRKIPKMTGKK